MRYTAMALYAAVLLAALPSARAATYGLTDTQPIPGVAKWDYLSFDPENRHLFITQGDHIDVFDTLTKTLVGAVPYTQGVHGVALVSDLHRGFATDGKADAVTVFDMATFKPIKILSVGKKPMPSCMIPRPAAFLPLTEIPTV